MTAPRPAPLRTRGVVGLGLAATLVPLNSTMIAVALPDIATDLGVAKGSTGLLITIYLVVMLVGQPAAGRLTDSLGDRRTFVVALSGFAIVSVMAAFVNSFELLVMARGVQAVFGAALLPSSQSVLRSVTLPERRGRSFGMLESFIGVGATAGPVVGGLLTQWRGWNGVFLVNLPLVVVALALTRDLPAAAAPSKAAADKGGGIWAVLSQQAFGAAFVTRAASTLAQYSFLLVAPIVLDERGLKAGEIGLALTALTVGMILLGPTGGQLGDRYGRRLPVLAGTVLSTLAVISAVVWVESSTVGLILAMGAYGFGFGLATPGITTAALESVPEAQSGSASGFLSMSRYVGSIPASLLLATLVGDQGDGAVTVMVIAASVMGLAILASTRLPASVGEADHISP